MSTNRNTQAVKVKDFSLPSGDLGRKVLITGIIMLLSARGELLQPGSPLYDYVLAGRPTLLRAAKWIQNGLFYFLFGAHGIETPLFAWTRLRPHGVPVFSLLWVKWMLSCFVGGVFVFRQFDEIVAKRTA